MPFKIIRNDITAVKADAIVNLTNPDPAYLSGIENAVYQAAGADQLLAERRKAGKLKPGQAVVTSACQSDAKYIIHTAGPEWQKRKSGQIKKLKLCYKNCLQLARRYECESIAFPLISADTYKFSKDKALNAALTVISEFLSTEDMMVYLVIFDKESFHLTEKLFAEVATYIDEHYVEEKSSKISFTPNCFSQKPVPRCFQDLSSSSPIICSAPELSYHPKSDRKKLRSSCLTEDEEEDIERSLEDVMAELGETFQERLFRLIEERRMTDVEVYKKANIDRKLFSKIRCNVDYRPKKITVIALAVALRLNLDETKDLLARAEFALSPSNKFDLIITFFIEHKVYDIYKINIALFQHDQPTLGE